MCTNIPVLVHHLLIPSQLQVVTVLYVHFPSARHSFIHPASALYIGATVNPARWLQVKGVSKAEWEIAGEKYERKTILWVLRHSRTNTFSWWAAVHSLYIYLSTTPSPCSIHPPILCLPLYLCPTSNHFSKWFSFFSIEPTSELAARVSLWLCRHSSVPEGAKLSHHAIRVSVFVHLKSVQNKHRIRNFKHTPTRANKQIRE